jgi:hypothetical protein
MALHIELGEPGFLRMVVKALLRPLILIFKTFVGLQTIGATEVALHIPSGYRPPNVALIVEKIQKERTILTQLVNTKRLNVTQVNNATQEGMEEQGGLK